MNHKKIAIRHTSYSSGPNLSRLFFLCSLTSSFLLILANSSVNSAFIYRDPVLRFDNRGDIFGAMCTAFITKPDIEGYNVFTAGHCCIRPYSQLISDIDPFLRIPVQNISYSLYPDICRGVIPVTDSVALTWDLEAVHLNKQSRLIALTGTEKIKLKSQTLAINTDTLMFGLEAKTSVIEGMSGSPVLYKGNVVGVLSDGASFVGVSRLVFGGSKYLLGDIIPKKTIAFSSYKVDTYVNYTLGEDLSYRVDLLECKNLDKLTTFIDYHSMSNGQIFSKKKMVQSPTSSDEMIDFLGNKNESYSVSKSISKFLDGTVRVDTKFSQNNDGSCVSEKRILKMSNGNKITYVNYVYGVDGSASASQAFYEFYNGVKVTYQGFVQRKDGSFTYEKKKQERNAEL